MNDPDLERRLARLEPTPPPPGLRDAVLRRLAAPRPGRLLRFAWAAAAVALVALVGLNSWVESRHEARVARLVGAPPPSRRAQRTRAVEQDLTSILADRALRWRLRRILTARRVPDTPAFSIPGGSRNG